jgi:hypothetical protein
MKIKIDFVTNSSSTSFLLACDTDFTQEEFMKLIGINYGSPLEPIFIRLYELIRREMKLLSECEIDLKIAESHPNVAKKLSEAKRSGKMIYEGELGTENGDVIESYFCLDSFEVENEHFYLNYLDCIW